ncbi:MAG: GNAT family N-acetyltransferase [Acidobacteriales bacterium]|nr:GNAT family N-acetyltransferase [Terriglobales bacterium]
MPLTTRKCANVEEFELCVKLQKEVWGFEDLDVIPLRMFVVADKVGGQVIGTFAGGQLVGFALAIPGMRNGHPYLHSHMLAVKESHRNAGLGRTLKLAQREDALARGYELIEWTFDPLEIKNAYLNIMKLGAIARRYTINQYGATSSPLHGNLPTDRLIAEWWIKSKRVSTLLESDHLSAFATQTAIEVPGKIYQWKVDPMNRDKAAAVQLRNRESFLHEFAEGRSVLGYERGPDGAGRFLLGHWDEDWSYAS